MKTLAELAAIRERMQDKVNIREHNATMKIVVGMATCGISAGARPAEAGEVTRRAFLNDKMDLIEAEAVIDLIDSETELSARNAAEQMGGALGREIGRISSELTAIAAEFYAFVDYPDD